jgi:hypothetical protein
MSFIIEAIELALNSNSRANAASNASPKLLATPLKP